MCENDEDDEDDENENILFLFRMFVCIIWICM